MTISPVKVTAREFQGAFGSSSNKARHHVVIIAKHGVLARRHGGSVLRGATGAWAYG